MTLLAVTNDLRVEFPRRRSIRELRPAPFVAVEGANLELRFGEITGLVGESGSGKSTLARALLRLVPFAGSATVAGFDVGNLRSSELATYRRRVQAVFQDPLQALNPRHDVRQLVGEPLTIHGNLTSRELRARVVELVESVGLEPDHLKRTSRDLSGGQRQRVAIARAIALDPVLVVLDEALSALDVTTAASVARLLRSLLRPDSGMLFIGHDLAVVRQLCDRVYVMRTGEIVESGEADSVCGDPQHPYTQKLIESIPQLLNDVR